MYMYGLYSASQGWTSGSQATVLGRRGRGGGGGGSGGRVGVGVGVG